MIATVLLLFLLLIFTIVFLTLLVKGKLGERKPLFILLLFFGFIILVFLFTGVEKVQADLSRFFRNTAPKDADKVYELLFKKSPASCVTFVNFKDQVVPKIDCCIWMEARLCPGELTRILALKKYERTSFSQGDSPGFLKPFVGRPSWWTPQTLNNTITKASINPRPDSEQTLFFGPDSSHIYICDLAL